ncbi:hypothetical protein [Pedobacter aquatilis]|uniref:hypothetical protein n=1 Tax=Pedobacter aquatilis TaxID=351343 RepID=UPI00292E1B56|nr:hypothetical protein [Pedobacter aquatilis]
MLKSRPQFAFVLLIFGIFVFILIFTLFFQHRNGSFSFTELASISDVIQGTLGVAVSFAGALVAIKLARISTLLIEKEKAREDNKSYNEIISAALTPFRTLSNTITELYLNSADFDHVFSDVLRYPSESESQKPISNLDLVEISRLLDNHLRDMISALENIQKDTFSYALWLMRSNYNAKAGKFIERGGSSGFNVSDTGEMGHANVSFLADDITHTLSNLKLLQKNFRQAGVNDEDIQLVKKMLERQISLTRKEREGRGEFGIGINLYDRGIAFYGMTYLLSLHFDNLYKVPKDVFQSRYLGLLTDFYRVFPDKEGLEGFSKIVFSSGAEVSANNPQLNAFELLRDAYWFPFLLHLALNRDLYFRQLDAENLEDKPFRLQIIKWNRSRLNIYYLPEYLYRKYDM